jgi:hypothetical protein
MPNSWFSPFSLASRTRFVLDQWLQGGVGGFGLQRDVLDFKARLE